MVINDLVTDLSLIVCCGAVLGCERKSVTKRIRQSGHDVRSSFAVSVKARRHHLGITQEELAWRAGLHRTYITDIERGARNLSLHSIEKLARALQSSIAELFALPAASPDSSLQPASDAVSACVDILLVEDQPDDEELTLQAFRAARLKNRVHIARDGAAAMDFLFRQGASAKAWMPHQELVVLLDLNLPKLSGLEVLRLIRSDARTLALPVVVLTASDKSRDIAECRRLGCTHYITKPVGFENFSRVTADLHLDWKLVRGLPVSA